MRDYYPHTGFERIHLPPGDEHMAGVKLLIETNLYKHRRDNQVDDTRREILEVLYLIRIPRDL